MSCTRVSKSAIYDALFASCFYCWTFWSLQDTEQDADDGTDGAGDASRLQVAVSPTRHVCCLISQYVAKWLCWLKIGVVSVVFKFFSWHFYWKSFHWKIPSIQCFDTVGCMSEMQMICRCSSWFNCHPIISCFVKVQCWLRFWCRLTQSWKPRKLNREDAMDHSRWRKQIRDDWWSWYVWVGECFFWYRLTQVVSDKSQRAVKRL